MGSWIAGTVKVQFEIQQHLLQESKNIHKKMWHANLRAWNGRAIMTNNKLNCIPFQMTNVVNLSLRRVHNSERKNQVLLHGFVQTTKQIHLLQG